MDNIKNIICLLFFCMLCMSSQKITVDQIEYQHRLVFMQNRSRMLEEMFNKDYLEGRMRDDYRDFYVTMIVSLDSCIEDMKKWKVQ